MSTVHVACAAAGPYVAHSAGMLHSVLTHAGDLHVHYLHGPELPRAEAAALEALVGGLGGTLTRYPVAPERLAGLPVHPQFTAAMWHRILLPELLPDLPRVLYLDVDALALDALEPLWETSLDGALAGAVRNVFQHDHRHRPRELGLPGERDYLNSGVLLLDLDALRREGVAAQLRAVALERGGGLAWPDQDVLNLVLAGRWRALPPRWNATNALWAFGPAARRAHGLRARRAARAHPAIRHFEGPEANKPWHPDCTQPLRERWLEHRRAAAWPLRA